MGGEVFDEVARADSDIQRAFLELLTAIRRDPYEAAGFDVEAARAWGEGRAYMAGKDGVSQNCSHFCSLGLSQRTEGSMGSSYALAGHLEATPRPG
jgi:hypothetical protein